MRLNMEFIINYNLFTSGSIKIDAASLSEAILMVEYMSDEDLLGQANDLILEIDEDEVDDSE